MPKSIKKPVNKKSSQSKLPKSSVKLSTKPSVKATMKANKLKSKGKTVVNKKLNLQFGTKNIKSALVSIKETYQKQNGLFRPVVLIILLLLIVGFMFRKQLIVATVNGKPITRFALIKELEKTSGKATLESLITQKLVYQEADKLGVKVTDEELDSEIKAIEENIKAQGQDLDALLVAQGMTKKDLLEQIRIQKVVEKIVGQGMEVTDEEVSNYITENKDFLSADMTEEELKATVKEQLLQQKVSAKIQTWLEELKSNSSINKSMFE